MIRSVSIATKIQQLTGLLGTKDINGWEQGFIESVRGALPPHGQTTALSEAQVAKVEQIWERHFA